MDMQIYYVSQKNDICMYACIKLFDDVTKKYHEILMTYFVSEIFYERSRLSSILVTQHKIYQLPQNTLTVHRSKSPKSQYEILKVKYLSYQKPNLVRT